MQHGLHHGEPPLSPQQAEIEYHNALSKLTGEQYELMPPADSSRHTRVPVVHNSSCSENESDHCQGIGDLLRRRRSHLQGSFGADLS